MGNTLSKHQLRIIGGQWRGRKLDIADVEGLRPTGNRIRETLFNWLMGDLPGSRCLDLFAGSGALGFECLSRGADQVIWLEKHPLAAKQLKKHCQKLDINPCQVVECDSLEWLHQHSLDQSSIDIVFIDPPFAYELWDAAIELLASSRLLKDGALIYIETPKNTQVHTPDNWQALKAKQSGQICYQLFRYQLPA